MNNPWFKYIVIRVGLFVGLLAIMLALQFDPFFAALISAVVSLAISLLLFEKHRSAVSEDIFRRIQKRNDRDTDVEDAADDSAKGDSKEV